MRIIPDITRHGESEAGMTLTIGSFDGVHLGHRRILERLVETARAANTPAGLMTLRPHPRALFAPENAPARLCNDAQQQRLLEEVGLDALFVLPFDARVAALDREAFLNDIVLRRCGARRLVVGHDFVFGKDAGGNFEYLAEQAGPRGFAVEQAEALIVQGERVSSTLIRELILRGAVEQVPAFLGRPYGIAGEVVQGRNVGASLGFPTANILPGEYVVPAHGVYAAEVVIDGTRHPAATNIGVAPTVRNEDVFIEAHLLDFDGDLRGRQVEFIFHKRFRSEKRFANLEALKAAIAGDIAAIRAYFAA